MFRMLWYKALSCRFLAFAGKASKKKAPRAQTEPATREQEPEAVVQGPNDSSKGRRWVINAATVYGEAADAVVICNQ